MTMSGGIKLAERKLRAQLITTFTAVKASTALIDLIFEDIPDADKTEIKNFISADDLESRIYMGYFRRDVPKFPVISITLNSDTHSDSVIGDTIETETVQTTATEGKLFEKSYSITIYSANPDLTIYLYTLCKHSMLSAINTLTSEGYYDIILSGRDLQPVSDYSPSILYKRVLTVTLKTFDQTDSTYHRIIGYDLNIED